MGLIERIKSALGLGTSTSAPQRRGGTTDRSAGSADADDRSEPTPAGEVERDEAVESAQTVVSTADSSSAASSGDEGAEEGVDVTVEHEPATETEDAVKGTTTAASDSNASGAATASSDATASTTDATEPTPAADEQGTTDDSETAGEPETTAGEADTAAVSADLEDIKGIGPTYADRLRGAGVDDVPTLAAADPADLAERVDIPEARLEEMVERAGTY